jgi:hypothetical protein
MSDILSSDLVAGLERASIVLGAVRCQRCPAVRSAIPHDMKFSDNVLKLFCPCGAVTLLEAELIEWEPVEEAP